MGPFRRTAELPDIVFDSAGELREEKRACAFLLLERTAGEGVASQGTGLAASLWPSGQAKRNSNGKCRYRRAGRRLAPRSLGLVVGCYLRSPSGKTVRPWTLLMRIAADAYQAISEHRMPS